MNSLLKKVFQSYYDTSIILMLNVEMSIKKTLHADIPRGHNKNP